MDNNIIDKRTKGEWILENNPFFANRRRVNINPFQNDLTTILVIEDYTENKEISKANAAFIVTACNEYDKLKEENKQLKDISDTVAAAWEKGYNKLKEDNKRLLEALKVAEKIVYRENAIYPREWHQIRESIKQSEQS